MYYSNSTHGDYIYQGNFVMESFSFYGSNIVYNVLRKKKIIESQLICTCVHNISRDNSPTI